MGLKQWLESKHIVPTIKTGANKSNFAEFGIYLVKSRLFRLLRGKYSDDWPRYLHYVVEALNNRPLEKLGNLRPIDIKSPLDDVKVQKAQQEHHVEPFSEPSWDEQDRNQKEYDRNKQNLQPGDFVYLDNRKDVFGKSFHIQVNENSYEVNLFSTFLLQRNTTVDLNERVWFVRSKRL